jgi:myo-inositol-1(or 4)-monophosphatase
MLVRPMILSTPRVQHNQRPMRRPDEASVSTAIRFEGVSTIQRLATLYRDAEPGLRDRMMMAAQAAEDAGKIIMKYYRKDVKVGRKDDESPVTIADRKADELIRSRITHFFGSDAMITEEGFKPGQSRSLKEGWIVDPMDGTTNFTTKTGPFGVSIAYLRKGEPVVGVVYDPLKKEMFTAIKGRGAFLNGKPIRVSDAVALSKATVVSTYNPPPASLAMIPHTARRLGCTAIDTCYEKITSWDIAAGMLIVKEAGGHVTDLDGSPLDLSQEKLSYLASNGKLHDTMRELLGEPRVLRLEEVPAEQTS